MLQLLSLALSVVLGWYNSCFSRTIHRLSAAEIPEIITQWEGETKTYRLRHSNLEIASIFDIYDPVYLEKHTLPNTRIRPRNPAHPSFLGSELKELLEELVAELQKSNNKRTKFKQFTVLKQRDYNPRKKAGLIILKCKKYPIIVKIFMETPESFVAPFSKGFEPSVFFIMASTNRFLSGMLRIKNAEAIKKQLEQDPYWSERVDTPRKWFWQPRHQRWFSVKSNYCGTQRSVVLPSVYAVVCDAIEPDETFDIFNKEHRALAIELSHYLGMRLDPHIDNFLREKHTQKLVIVDAEPFSVMVGLREPLPFNNYFDWYRRLVWKCFCDGFLRDKKIRTSIHRGTVKPILRC